MGIIGLVSPSLLPSFAGHHRLIIRGWPSPSGIVERLGRFHKVMHSGLNVLVPFTDRVRAMVDLREHVVDIPLAVITGIM